MDWSLYELFCLYGRHPDFTIKWFQNKRLLKDEMFCKSCNRELSWAPDLSDRDLLCWKCINGNCDAVCVPVSCREESWFAKSNLSLQYQIQLLYLWCGDVSEDVVTTLYNVSDSFVRYAYGVYRTFCSEYFDSNPIELGGPNVFVLVKIECAEFPSYPGKFINFLVMVDTSRIPMIGYIQALFKREKSIASYIEKFVKAGSIVSSDLSEDLEKKVRSSIQFIQSNSSQFEYLQLYWIRHKLLLIKNATNLEFIDLYKLNVHIYANLWKERFGYNSFYTFIQQIQTLYPL